MKIWKLTTTVHSEDDFDAAKVLRMIDRDANRGDGIYVKVTGGKKPLLKLIRKVKE